LSGLDNFAAAYPTRSGPVCASCALRRDRPDMWAEIVAGRAQAVPHSFRLIADYLRTHGINIRYSQLRDHFADHEGKR